MMSQKYVAVLILYIGTLPFQAAAGSKGVGLRPIACWDYGFESR
jgi:hypothetical protein